MSAAPSLIPRQQFATRAPCAPWACRLLIRRHPRAAILLLAMLMVLTISTITNAGVEVVDDEVIFSLVAPGATSVFLVGNFNNWNPTLEKMEQDGDRFQVMLFLLTGSYRYKFVVDGEWIDDPDNLPKDSTKGSSLALEERSGMLTLATDPVDDPADKPKLELASRYRGIVSHEESDTDSDHEIDLYLGFGNERVRALTNFRTSSDTWDASPLRGDVTFDRGFVETQFGGLMLRAFENDSVWASNDPFQLVGAVGIFDDNVGYERKGFSVEWPLSSRLQFRALYTDKLGAAAGQVVVPESAFGSFATSTTNDTTVYRFADRFGDHDTWTWEVFLNSGSFKLGYVFRENRGLHPGLLVETQRDSTQFNLQAFNTREDWDANVFWLSWRALRFVTLRGGLGRGKARVRELGRTTSRDSTLIDIGIGQDVERLDREVPLQMSTRWHGALEFKRSNTEASVTYEWSEFEFDPFVVIGSRATVSRIALAGSFQKSMYRLSGLINYIDQEYGNAPVDFHYRTQTRNFWLDYSDDIAIHRFATFDLERASDMTLEFEWQASPPTTRQKIAGVGPLAVIAQVNLAGPEFFEALEYASLRVAAERQLTGPFYGAVDLRWARYDKPEWDFADTFFASYFEAGYRQTRVELSFGVGFDPFVLRRVINDYDNIGREEFLHEAVFEGLTREGSAALGERLRIQEQRLADLNSFLKLEFVFLF